MFHFLLKLTTPPPTHTSYSTSLLRFALRQKIPNNCSIFSPNQHGIAEPPAEEASAKSPKTFPITAPHSYISGLSFWILRLIVKPHSWCIQKSVHPLHHKRAFSPLTADHINGVPWACFLWFGYEGQLFRNKFSFYEKGRYYLPTNKKKKSQTGGTKRLWKVFFASEH